VNQEMQHPAATVLDHGIIRSVGDFVRLGVIDWMRYKPYWRSPQQAMQVVSAPFINKMRFLIAQLDLYDYPERNDFPGWKHVGNHEELGLLYWNHFHYVFEGELHFHDQPDFSGVIIHRDGEPTEWPFWGDIGQVSPITLLDTSRALLPHTLWISVLDAQTQVVIEPLPPEDADHTAILKLLAPFHIQWHCFGTSVFLEYKGENVYLGEKADVAQMNPELAHSFMEAILMGEEP
jgi:hypothetical protein